MVNNNEVDNEVANKVANESNDNNVMLTTVDNPFSPFTQFDEWLAFDTEKGYSTPNYLARIANTSDELSEEDEQLEITRAINEIVDFNILGIYKKVTPDDYKNK